MDLKVDDIMEYYDPQPLPPAYWYFLITGVDNASDCYITRLIYMMDKGQCAYTLYSLSSMHPIRVKWQPSKLTINKFNLLWSLAQYHGTIG